MKGPLAIALLLGAASVLGFAPFDLFSLPLLTLALLFAQWRRAGSPRAAALLGFGWGLGFFLTGVSWVYVSLHDVGGMEAPIAGLATLLFGTLLSLFPALAGYAFRRTASTRCGAFHPTGIPCGHAIDFSSPPRLFGSALLVAGLWTCTEWLRGTLLSGFPWLALGYSQSPPALIAALAAFSWRRPWGREMAAAAVVIAALLGLGALLRGVAWTAPVGAPLEVVLLQGNVAQSLKWDPERLALSIDTYLRLARENPAPLTVLPETAIPLMFDEVPRQVLSELTANGDLLLGVAVRGAAGGYVNGAVALSPKAPASRTPDSVAKPAVTTPAATTPKAPTHAVSLPPTFFTAGYAKRHLVPFGEFVPPGFSWFFDLVRIPMSAFTPGPAVQAPLTLGGQKIMPNICYEDLFGEELIHALPEATLLVNISNTAWFGHSLAQPQHLQIARMRALETGRPMLRATNTGMTAAVMPDGTVVAVLEPHTTGALRIKVQGYQGLTPYARWGNLAALLLALAAVAFAVVPAAVPAVVAALRRRGKSR